MQFAGIRARASFQIVTYGTGALNQLPHDRLQTRRRGVVRIGDILMKIIVFALLALTVLAGVAAPPSAVDGKDSYEQDRTKF